MDWFLVFDFRFFGFSGFLAAYNIITASNAIVNPLLFGFWGYFSLLRPQMLLWELYTCFVASILCQMTTAEGVQFIGGNAVM